MSENKYYPMILPEKNIILTFRVPLSPKSFKRWRNAQLIHTQNHIEYELLKELFDDEIIKEMLGDNMPTQAKPNPNSVTIEKGGEKRPLPHVTTFRAEALPNGQSEVIGICMGVFMRPEFDKMLAIIGNKFPESRQDFVDFLHRDQDHQRMLIILTRAYLDWDIPFEPIETTPLATSEFKIPHPSIAETVSDWFHQAMGEIVDSKPHLRENGRILFELNWHSLGYVGQVDMVLLGPTMLQLQINLVEHKDNKVTERRKELLEAIQVQLSEHINENAVQLANEINNETAVSNPNDIATESNKEIDIEEFPQEGDELREKARISQEAKKYRVQARTIQNWERIAPLLNKGLTDDVICEVLGMPPSTIRDNKSKMKKNGYWKEHITVSS